MTRLILAFALLIQFSYPAFAADSETTLVLGRAVELSSQGEITDEALIAKLKKVMKNSDLPSETRLKAAYLFTFITIGVDDEGKNEAVEFALSSKDAEKFLSAEAIIRLYRLRGDHAYDNAKFALALEAYSQVLGRVKKSDPRADYAIVRRGWAYMNQDNSEKAFSLWLTEVMYRLHNKMTLSTTILHGLGQAYTENGKRLAQDGTALASMPLNVEQRESLSKGLVDGVNYLKSSKEIEKWWSDVSVFPWRNEIAATIEESSYATGRRACELLPLLTQKRNASALGAGNMRLVENCSEAYFHGDPATKGASLALHELFGRFELKGEQRRLRYNLYKYDKEFAHACKEGIAWVGDEEGVQTPTLPMKELVGICQKAIDSKNANEFATDLLGISVLAPKAFRSTSDPALYLANALIKKPVFADAVAIQMIQHPERYRETLLPRVATEALVLEKSFQNAEAMRVAFGAVPHEDNDHLWSDLRTRKFRALVDENKLDAGREFLNLECPLKSVDPDCQPLWIWLVAKEIADPLRVERAKTSASQVLSGEISVDSSSLAKWMDLGVQVGLSSNVWSGIKKIDAEQNGKARMSDRVKLSLFESLATGKLELSSQEVNTLKDAQLKEIVSFATVVREKSASQVVKVALPKTSPLSADLTALKHVDNRAKAALKKRSEPVEELSAWVDFLNSNSKGVGRRSWISLVMYSKGIETVERFCVEANSRLSNISPSKQISSGEWRQMVKLLGERLGQCRAWIEKTKNEMQTKIINAGENT